MYKPFEIAAGFELLFIIFTSQVKKYGLPGNY